MRISDWSSDVCSSDLAVAIGLVLQYPDPRDANVRMPRRDHFVEHRGRERSRVGRHARCRHESRQRNFRHFPLLSFEPALHPASWPANTHNMLRSEEHTSELQSLMRISYAVFCLKKKKNTINTPKHITT